MRWAKMKKNEPKWIKMSQISQHESNEIKMRENELKWVKMQMSQNERKWVKMQISQKWVIMSQIKFFRILGSC